MMGQSQPGCRQVDQCEVHAFVKNPFVPDKALANYLAAFECSSSKSRREWRTQKGLQCGLEQTGQEAAGRVRRQHEAGRAASCSERMAQPGSALRKGDERPWHLHAVPCPIAQYRLALRVKFW